MPIQTFVGYYWEFGVVSRHYPQVDNYLNSHYLSACSAWKCIKIVRRIYMLVNPGSERVNVEVWCRGPPIPPCKIDSRKSIGAFHVSRTNILSRSRKKNEAITFHVEIKEIHGLILCHPLILWSLLLSGFTGEILFYFLENLRNPHLALKTKAYYADVD